MSEATPESTEAEVPRRRGSDRLYRSVDVMVATGMTRREIGYSLANGWLTAIAGPRGNGSPLRFTFEELRTAKVFAALRRVGLEHPVAAHLARRVIGRADGLAVEVVPGVTLTVTEADLSPTAVPDRAPGLARRASDRLVEQLLRDELTDDTDREDIPS